jgi:hypothetical protein
MLPSLSLSQFLPRISKWSFTTSHQAPQRSVGPVSGGGGGGGGEVGSPALGFSGSKGESSLGAGRTAAEASTAMQSRVGRSILILAGLEKILRVLVGVDGEDRVGEQKTSWSNLFIGRVSSYDQASFDTQRTLKLQLTSVLGIGDTYPLRHAWIEFGKFEKPSGMARQMLGHPKLIPLALQNQKV